MSTSRWMYSWINSHFAYILHYNFWLHVWVCFHGSYRKTKGWLVYLHSENVIYYGSHPAWVLGPYYIVCSLSFSVLNNNYLEIRWRLLPHGKAVTGNAESYELEQLSSYPLHSARPFLEWQWYLADSCRPTTSWSLGLDAVYAYKICCIHHWRRGYDLPETIAWDWWHLSGSLKTLAWYKYDRHSVMWCRGGHWKITSLQNS